MGKRANKQDALLEKEERRARSRGELVPIGTLTSLSTMPLTTRSNSRTTDLGQIFVIKKRGSNCPFLEQSGDLARTQRSNPPKPFDPAQLLVDPGLGDHPPVAHDHHLLEPKALAHLLYLAAQGHRISRVACKSFHRYRTTLPVTEQSVLNLEFALFAIAIEPEARQLAAFAFQVTGGQVVEHKAA